MMISYKDLDDMPVGTVIDTVADNGVHEMFTKRGAGQWVDNDLGMMVDPTIFESVDRIVVIR